jgi:hypothetical protein
MDHILAYEFRVPSLGKSDTVEIEGKDLEVFVDELASGVTELGQGLLLAIGLDKGDTFIDHLFSFFRRSLLGGEGKTCYKEKYHNQNKHLFH